MPRSRVLAVDLGATSIRVASVDVSQESADVDVIHRWRHSPIPDASGSLRWDWDGIVAEVERGLEKGIEGGDVVSIGVDGWGVDYGLIDPTGRLIDQPYAYRDSRTDGWEEIADRIGREDLYRITGVQLMGINTIFQLAADAPERLAEAGRVLLLPDLLVNHLTGWVGCELSNMSTTGLMDARARDWSSDLVDRIGIEPSLLPTPIDAGAMVGTWRNVPVHLVGSHDTASAFLGAPITGPGSAVLSTGSWVVVGVERDAPIVTADARAANFSNEAGAFGGVRFLKNVVGFWILEQCRTEWGTPTMDDLMAAMHAVEHPVPTFDATDHRFVSPDNMLREVLEASGLAADASFGIVGRCIVESIAESALGVVSEIESTTGVRVDDLALIGGGARIPLLAQVVEEKSGLAVTVGSAEAAALGNAVAQGIAIGRFSSLEDARRWLTPNEIAA